MNRAVDLSCVEGFWEGAMTWKARAEELNWVRLFWNGVILPCWRRVTLPSWGPAGAMHPTYALASAMGGPWATAPRPAIGRRHAAPVHFSLDISLPPRYGTRGEEGGRDAGTERYLAVRRPGGGAGRDGPAPGGGGRLSGPQPERAGGHGVRALGVDPPPGHAEGPGGPRVPGGVGDPGAARPARQAARPPPGGAAPGPGGRAGGAG